MEFWEFLLDPRNARLRDLESAARDLKFSAESDHDRLRELEARVRQLTLISAALWEIVKGKVEVTDEEFVNTLTRLSARGAAVGGLEEPGIAYCPTCRHKLSAGLTRCIYCGEDLPPSEPPPA